MLTSSVFEPADFLEQNNVGNILKKFSDAKYDAFRTEYFNIELGTDEDTASRSDKLLRKANEASHAARLLMKVFCLLGSRLRESNTRLVRSEGSALVGTLMLPQPST